MNPVLAAVRHVQELEAENAALRAELVVAREDADSAKAESFRLRVRLDREAHAVDALYAFATRTKHAHKHDIDCFDGYGCQCGLANAILGGDAAIASRAAVVASRTKEPQ